MAELLLDAERLLERELVVGVQDPGDAGRIQRLAVGRDFDARLRVRDLLDAYRLQHVLTSKVADRARSREA
jgi:hypothetical protein